MWGLETCCVPSDKLWYASVLIEIWSDSVKMTGFDKGCDCDSAREILATLLVRKIGVACGTTWYQTLTIQYN